jgi:predicted HTH transcriptional regulator
MSNYIQNLIEEGEHRKQDFKFEISDVRKIAKTFVAFSNTAGGKLLVGVKDNGQIDASGRWKKRVYFIRQMIIIFKNIPENSLEAHLHPKETVSKQQIAENDETYHDLDYLTGTCTDKDAKDFTENTRHFENYRK